MAKRKRAIHADIKPWLSAKNDCQEGRFIQVGNSLLLSKKFGMLGDGAKNMYFCMAMESAGKRSFHFPARAFKKYNIPNASGRRHIKELEKGGFITVDSGKCVRAPNIYSFSYDWKN